MKLNNVILSICLFLFSLGGFAQEKGELVDKRDGQKYTTIKIENQWWMAQNLNFKLSERQRIEGNEILDEIGLETQEYPESERMEDIYGQFYTWQEACEVCPEGWKLPSKTDWEELFENVGGKEIAAAKLASHSELWAKSFNKKIKPVGFNIEPAGYRFYILFRHWEAGNRTFFWSRTVKNEQSAFGFDFHAGYNKVFGGDLGYQKLNAISVRCIKE